MAEDEEVRHEFSAKLGQFWLWLGLLLPPTAWAIQLQTIYLLIEYGCYGGSFMPVHVVSGLMLIMSAAGTLLSWQNWMKAGGQWKSEEADPLARSRFMGIVGVLLGALLTLLIFAQWLPALMSVPCEK